MAEEDRTFTVHEPSTNGLPRPHWLGRLAQQVIGSFYAAEPLAPVGCHIHHHETDEPAQWEVTLFVSSTEIFGGAFDGKRTASRFMVDLRELAEIFDDVHNFYWQAQTMSKDDQLGPHIGVEGEYEGQSVWLRITANPPAQFEPGRVVDLHTHECHNRW